MNARPGAVGAGIVGAFVAVVAIRGRDGKAAVFRADLDAIAEEAIVAASAADGRVDDRRIDGADIRERTGIVGAAAARVPEGPRSGAGPAADGEDKEGEGQFERPEHSPKSMA